MSTPAAHTPSAFNRKNPLIARVPLRRLLSEGCEEKDTWHIEIDLQGSGLTYEPGDSMAILPTNCPDYASDLLGALGFSGEELVKDPEGLEVPVKEALINSFAISQPDRKFMAKLVEKAGDSASGLASLLDPEKKEELNQYLWGREIIDLVLEHPNAKWEPQEFVDILKKLTVRLYSIASSLAAKPNQCHLTVAAVRYQSHGRQRKGVCSTFLADRIDSNTRIPCFVTPGKAFRLPPLDDPSPVIMCGPGTGVAPFRAFVQERQATGAKSPAWLFFGEIHEATCFFYQEEWQAALADGSLTKLTTAFSRDQKEKIYVHHRMKQEGAELWQWLENGAIFYVCGDASRMAVDVDKALHEIIAEHGGRSVEEAAAYVEQMKKDKRYRRDVY
ncbi:MAG: sulfite reductase subunit alpha [Akkermansiaceae bacterium]|nr:sulfite reductase subunit alpha [Verrucomicrobiae bacterium]MCP5555629.1 sulfite reductase subunit alpha [Akkermansiaceae bacterium]